MSILQPDWIKNNLQFYLQIFIITALDVISKNIVFDFLNETCHDVAESCGVAVTSFFSLVRVLNNGISFGMMASLSHSKIIITSVAVIITLGMLYYLQKTKNCSIKNGLSLIIAGSIGNIYDRLYLGHVRDFIDIFIQDYHWPAFNIADSAIFIGAIVVFLADLSRYKNAKK